MTPMEIASASGKSFPFHDIRVISGLHRGIDSSRDLSLTVTVWTRGDSQIRRSPVTFATSRRW
jgi:hypothetical protein